MVTMVGGMEVMKERWSLTGGRGLSLACT